MPEQIDSKGRDASPELPTEVETLRSDAESDFTRSVVPINRRRSQLSMTLVWITGSAAFSTLYAGYALRVGGVGLWDLIIAALVGNIILLIYWWGACYLGARYGQTETLLARSFLGKTGSSLVSIFIVVISLGWFSFQADLFGTAATTLFNIPGALAWVSAGAALVMMTNNLFGFTSVTVWARYVAAPLVTLWVLYVFVKVFATTPSHVLFASPTTTSIPFGLAAGTILGSIIWGSEPDFWRWGKPRPSVGIVPSIIAIGLGNMLFPIAGAALAAIHAYTNFGKVVAYASAFTLGISGIMIIVFIVTQVAVNDMNLYEVVTAAKNLFPGPRYYYVIGLACVGAVFAYFQVINYFITIASLTGILVPSVTVVMMIDAWVIPRMFDLDRRVSIVPTWAQVGWINVPGVIAVAAGTVVGGFTAAVFIPTYSWGIGALNGWIVAIVVYIAGVALCRATLSREMLLKVLGYSHLSRAADASSGGTNYGIGQVQGVDA